MMFFGAHQSISGGFHKAAEIAQAATCDCVQIFTHSPSQWAVKPVSAEAKAAFQSDKLMTKNNNQWAGKPITPDEAAKFKAAHAAAKLQHPLSHNSYLINLAAPDEVLWEKSIAAMIEELRRADLLGIPYVVAHPGAFTSSSEEAGLRRIIAGFDRIHAEIPDIKAVTLLECTAGQGSCLGHRLEHLNEILAGVQQSARLAVCLDTCHLFAAGYPLADIDDYDKTMRDLDRLIGSQLVKAIHLNDSKKGLGSRVDRHEHIGQGEIGLEGFRNVLNDPRFTKVPMYLETPKDSGGDEGIRLDAENLRVLRSLIAGAEPLGKMPMKKDTAVVKSVEQKGSTKSGVKKTAPKKKT
jgi:deoxyribonuclease-4